MMMLDSSVAMALHAADSAQIDILGQGKLGSSTIIVNTCYSGMLCAETAAMAVRQSFARRGRSCNIRFYGACDTKQICQKAMNAHKANTEHHFGDVWDRVPALVRDGLLTKARSLRQAVEQRMDTWKKAGTSTSFIAATRRKLVSRLEKRFVEYACQKLSDCSWPPDAESYCSKHNMNCRVAPRRSDPLDLLVEIGGSTCVGWSALGNSWGWLDDAGATCLAYLHWIKHCCKPDFFLHECTAKFDHSVIERIMGDDMHVAAMLTSPVNWGVPVNRVRQYLLAAAKALKLISGSISWNSWLTHAAANDPTSQGGDEMLWQRWLQTCARAASSLDDASTAFPSQSDGSDLPNTLWAPWSFRVNHCCWKNK